MATSRIGSGRIILNDDKEDEHRGPSNTEPAVNARPELYKPPKRGYAKAKPNSQTFSKSDTDWRKSDNNSDRKINRKTIPSLPIPPLLKNERGPQYKHHENTREHFEDKRERGVQKNTNPKRQFRIGFKILEQWTNKDSHEIIVELMSHKTGFEDLLESNSLSGDCMILVIKILTRLCTTAFNANKTFVMNLVSKDKFMESLRRYIFEIQIQDPSDRRSNRYLWQDIDNFFENLSVLCCCIIESVPTRACEVLPKTLKVINLAMDYLISSADIKIAECLKYKFVDIQEKLILCQSELERQKKKDTKQNETEESPPDDFRELSVFPSTSEILSLNKPFVRRNVIDGPYDDADHYLDVQFRLLKEDFVAPLREGISEFVNYDIKEKRKQKFSNIRIHRHVEFISPYFSNEKAGVLLQFEFNDKKKVRHNFNYSRRFMYGSLLCFTNNNFATLIFGKVIERDQKLLEKKQIVVEFQSHIDTYKFNVPYVMVECSIYFEPYYYVLNALQNIYEDSFPMRKYLIDVSPEIDPPGYLKDAYFEINGYDVKLIEATTWPTANQLNFDDTQYDAFKSALTHNFSVIQGPPGTGKTYLGLQIAKTLLRNTDLWRTRMHPMLVVCFTNHALDQFLEGLIGTTEDIVRIGGQSKNKKLEKFNIRNKRNASMVRTHNHALSKIKYELQQKLGVIRMRTSLIDMINKCEGIISIRPLAQADQSLFSTWFVSVQDHEFVEWLLGGRTFEERKLKRREMDINKLMESLNDSDNIVKEVNPDAELEEALENEHRNAVEQINEFLDEIVVTTPSYICSVEQIIQHMGVVTTKLMSMGTDMNDVEVFNKKWQYEGELLELQDQFGYLKMRLQQGSLIKFRKKPTGIDLNAPHNMSPNDRWNLYFYWVELYKTILIEQLLKLQAEYRTLYAQYLELKDIDDLEIMKKMLVVGMTTTGAARLQATLQTLKCPIVIVEEAAEVLESHIVVSLTNHCQQLILIGDHKQLRPSTATYKLDKDFNLGISLFERMVRNKIQCNVLGVQHRMRPQFAKLIVPAIYPILKNHESVEYFPPVFGVACNLHFITHDHLEEEVGDNSKQNNHEANFLINFARYLIQNGYEAEDITIIAAYSGQMFALWRLRNKYEFLLKEVRITVLDNYQGEESKIILLSLVRNNKENKIGFLKNENRVCVALSRAKEGFYILGNMDILCKNSLIWPKIKEVFIEENALSTSLPLQCQIHRDVITHVKCGDDFGKVPEGGCSKSCGEALKCGHICSRVCHIDDRLHVTTKCKVVCEKILCNLNHTCKKMCYEECGKCQVLITKQLQCGHTDDVACSLDLSKFQCRIPVVSKLPCNHEVQNKPCYLTASMFRCPFDCDTRVEPCGHACLRLCHIRDDPDHLEYKCFKLCDRTLVGCSNGMHKCSKYCFEECPPCVTVIKKKRSICSHIHNIACNSNIDEQICLKPCKKILPCGHLCCMKCSDECGNCQQLVEKRLSICNHIVKTKCSSEPNRMDCKGNCPKTLPCGHQCTAKCNEPCTTMCLELVDHTKNVDCGHKFQIPCHMVNKDMESNDYELLKFCKQPCQFMLQCKHKCYGSCGECLQGRIHVTCKEKCGVPLVCGHECTTPCRVTCQPCSKPCDFRCTHSSCRKKCGEPCTKCIEPCTRRCKHITCKAKCGQICTVLSCDQPCDKKLKCGHQCVGFCGDRCPPLCRICDKEELCQIFFGYEEEADARFVLLLECKHIVESKGMEQWLNNPSNGDSNIVSYKRCPMCNTILSTTQRYGDYIKKSRQEVIDIKRKYFGVTAENERRRNELLQQLKHIAENWFGRPSSFLKQWNHILESFAAAIKDRRGNKRQPMNRILFNTFVSKIQVLENIAKIYKNASLKESSSFVTMSRLVNSFVSHLLPAEQRITLQENIDLDQELNRLECLAELLQIEERVVIKKESEEIINVHSEIKKHIFGIHVFSRHYNVTTKQNISNLQKKLEIANISRRVEERRQIISAMGMSLGHWYKCPNGHYYAIGDCGGADQIGRCNECGVQIGGTNHRLLQGNEHAGDFDNSARAAWPPH